MKRLKLGMFATFGVMVAIALALCPPGALATSDKDIKVDLNLWPKVQYMYKAALVGPGAGQMSITTYVGDHKVRTEVPTGTIIKWYGPDKVTQIILYTSQKQYIKKEMPYSDRSVAKSPLFSRVLPGEVPCVDSGDDACKDLGTADLLGRKTEKYRMTSKDDDSGRKVTVTMWIDPELRAVLQMVSTTPQGVETGTKLEEIKVGAQPASLFEIPAGYSPMRF